MNDEYRLISIRRKLKDLLMARRLSEDPERTGVVELADFGKRCERLAEYAAETKEEFGGRVHVIADELELAARLAAKLETLPRGGTRFQTQTGLLEEVARRCSTPRTSRPCNSASRCWPAGKGALHGPRRV